MGRTKKPPLVWQDHHDEGSFRSTWTSQANPELFSKTGDKTSTAGGSLSMKGNGYERPESAEARVKSEYNSAHETLLKDINDYDSSGTQGTMVSSH